LEFSSLREREDGIQVLASTGSLHRAGSFGGFVFIHSILEAIFFVIFLFGLFTASEEACTLFMANGKDTSMDDQVDAKLQRRGGVFFFSFCQGLKPFFEIEIYKYPLYIFT